MFFSVRNDGCGMGKCGKGGNNGKGREGVVFFFLSVGRGGEGMNES